MDFYDAALKRLLADSRSPLELEREMHVPSRTLYDIRSGKARPLQLRHGTVKKVAAYYFPKQIAA